MSEYKVELVPDLEAHGSKDKNIFMQYKEYRKHLEETGLDCDVWSIVINDEDIIGGFFPLGYAKQIAVELRVNKITLDEFPYPLFISDSGVLRDLTTPEISDYHD